MVDENQRDRQAVSAQMSELFSSLLAALGVRNF